MFAYIIRRLIQMVITMVAISVLGFAIIHSSPTNPFEEAMNPDADPTVAERKIVQHHLDKPIYRQYLYFYGDLFRDFGILAAQGIDSNNFKLKSFKTNEAVVPNLFRKALVTLPLVLVQTLIVWTLAFPLGIFSALRRGSVADRSMTIVAFALISIPSFWLSLQVIRFFAGLGIPVAGPSTIGTDLDGVRGFFDSIWHIAVPAIIGALGGIAILTRYVKGQMLEVLSADFVRTARAKGLDADTVHYKHALRNAALPFVVMLSSLLPALFSSSIIFEAIFAWPGLGRWSYNAVISGDYSIILTTFFVSSGLTLVSLLISDLLLVLVDPRIRLS